MQQHLMFDINSTLAQLARIKANEMRRRAYQIQIEFAPQWKIILALPAIERFTPHSKI